MTENNHALNIVTNNTIDFTSKKLTGNIDIKITSGISLDLKHEYSNKEEIFYSAVLAPDIVAPWMKDSEQLWDLIQNKFDIKKGTGFCKIIELALPNELTNEQNVELLKEFILVVLSKNGVIVDANMYIDNFNKSHALLILSTREIVLDYKEGDYTFGKKIRGLDSIKFCTNTSNIWSDLLNQYLAHHERNLNVSYSS